MPGGSESSSLLTNLHFYKHIVYSHGRLWGASNLIFLQYQKVRMKKLDGFSLERNTKLLLLKKKKKNAERSLKSVVAVLFFFFSLYLAATWEQALEEDPWHKLSWAERVPAEYIREEVWMDRYITEQRGDCASAGAPEQDRPIAQLLSQQSITGISHAPF